MHNDTDRYRQGAPRPQREAFINFVFGVHTSPADGGERLVLKFGDDSDGGFLWAASTF